MKLQELLVCPICKSVIHLEAEKSALVCGSSADHVFPIVSNVPILINDSNSVFRISDYIEDIKKETIAQGLFDSEARRNNLPLYRQYYRRFSSWLTNFSVDLKRFSAVDAINEIQMLRKNSRILLVGAGEQRFNLESKDGVIVHTDVTISRGIDYVCDAHDLPFSDECFDLILLPSVLEHVADPYRTVDECFRTLKPNGRIFAVTPFLQPVHLGVYDFTRFTLTGYRRLFRRFEEIELSVSLGAGSTLAYSIQYFLRSLSDNHTMFRLLNLTGLLITRPLKYLDKFLRHKKAAIGYAAGYIFYGKKSEHVMSDRELVDTFRSRII